MLARLKNICAWLCLLAAFTLRAETISVCPTKTGIGWLEKTKSGALVLHLEGSYYDMGVEQATLLQDQTQMAVRTLKNMIHSKVPVLPADWSIVLLDKYLYQKEAGFIPEEFKQEMQGLADASHVDVRFIHVAHALDLSDQLRDRGRLGTRHQRPRSLFHPQ